MFDDEEERHEKEKPQAFSQQRITLSLLLGRSIDAHLAIHGGKGLATSWRVLEDVLAVTASKPFPT